MHDVPDTQGGQQAPPVVDGRRERPPHGEIIRARAIIDVKLLGRARKGRDDENIELRELVNRSHSSEPAALQRKWQWAVVGHSWSLTSPSSLAHISRETICTQYRFLAAEPTHHRVPRSKTVTHGLGHKISRYDNTPAI